MRFPSFLIMFLQMTSIYILGLILQGLSHIKRPLKWSFIQVITSLSMISSYIQCLYHYKYNYLIHLSSLYPFISAIKKVKWKTSIWISLELYWLHQRFIFSFVPYDDLYSHRYHFLKNYKFYYDIWDLPSAPSFFDLHLFVLKYIFAIYTVANI